MHCVLAGTETKQGFKQNISLSNQRWGSLVGARNEVRGTLRQGFRDLGDTVIKRKELVQKRFRELAASREVFLAPRFRMQGSFSYCTVNEPAWVPPQEIDLDDGVYLPTSFASLTDPVIAAQAFFLKVEEMVAPLCERRGWTLDQSKSSCVRIVLSSSAHVDLPLYAIPDNQFDDPEVVVKANGHATTEAETAELSERGYKSLPADRIMLAHRDGVWEQSDPRRMDDWFSDAIRDHGQHLRRICRYLKAWRDLHWQTPGDGMSSISLMACAVTAFDACEGRLAEDRDDVALLHVAERLPGLLGGPIGNPVIDGLRLDDAWDEVRREEYKVRAGHLHQELAAAMNGVSADTALFRLKKVLGGRVSDDISLVGQETEESSILGSPAAYVAAPTVRRSTSG